MLEFFTGEPVIAPRIYANCELAGWNYTRANRTPGLLIATGYDGRGFRLELKPDTAYRFAGRMSELRPLQSNRGDIGHVLTLRLRKYANKPGTVGFVSRWMARYKSSVDFRNTCYFVARPAFRAWRDATRAREAEARTASEVARELHRGERARYVGAVDRNWDTLATNPADREHLAETWSELFGTGANYLGDLPSSSENPRGYYSEFRRRWETILGRPLPYPLEEPEVRVNPPGVAFTTQFLRVDWTGTCVNYTWSPEDPPTGEPNAEA